MKLSSYYKELAMKQIAVYEAKNRFSELIAAVEQGDVVTITRRGVPVARLVSEKPVATSQDRRHQISAALAHLREIRASLTLSGDLKAVAREGLD